jgi:hypothetical protein
MRGEVLSISCTHPRRPIAAKTSPKPPGLSSGRGESSVPEAELSGVTLIRPVVFYTV